MKFTLTHLSTKKRLDWWLETRAVVHEAPNLPYLAWVPWDMNNIGARWLKCLLCNKFVDSEAYHTGTVTNVTGSREHQRNLRYCQPGSAWYEENVTKVRAKWHPTAVKIPESSVPQVPPPPPKRAGPPATHIPKTCLAQTFREQSLCAQHKASTMWIEEDC